MLSQRLNQIEESGIRKIFNLAAQSKGEFVNLSIGQPHFPASKRLKESACRAIKDDRNIYTVTAGQLELREKIALKLRLENNIPAKAEDVIVTSGSSGSIFLAMSATLNPGDEIIITDPYFVSYKQVALFLGLKIRFWNTYPDFRPDTANLEKLITKKTKALFLNSPNNPTGMAYGKDEIEAIARIAKKHKLLVFSDEIYEKFDYENKHYSIGRIYDKTVTLNGFSKSHSITGWRLGYAHGPSEIIAGMQKLQQYTFVCAPSMAQFAIIDCFDDLPTKEYAAYKDKRDLLYDSLKAKYDLVKTEGAFYAFIRIPDKRPNFVEELIKKKLLVVPGSVFSERSTHFRVSFAVDDKTLEKGIRILNSMA